MQISGVFINIISLRRPDELLGLLFVRAADDVNQIDAQGCVLARDLKLLDFDDVAEAVLQSALNHDLQSCGQLATVRCEDELQESAAEIGTVHALAGASKEKLLDHVTDVIVIRRRSCATTPVEVKW